MLLIDELAKITLSLYLQASAKPLCLTFKYQLQISDQSSGVNQYNPFRVYCRELAPGTVSLTRDRAQGDDS